MNAAIVFRNLFDQATLQASSWITAAPPEVLQDPHVQRCWRGRLGASEWVVADLGSMQEIDTFGLLCCQAIVADSLVSMTAASTSRIRVSATDPTGAFGEVYDSGVAAGRISERFRSMVVALPTAVNGQYVRFDMTHAGASALQFGRGLIGRRSMFTINHSYGWSFGIRDLSRKSKSAAGQTYFDRDERIRALTIPFNFIPEEERYGFVMELDLENGSSRDILFMLDPESPDINRDSVWGLIEDLTPGTNPQIDVYAKSYQLEERR